MESKCPQSYNRANPESKGIPVSFQDEDKGKTRPQTVSQLKDKKTHDPDRFEGPIQFGQDADADVDHLLPYSTGDDKIGYEMLALMREDGATEADERTTSFAQFRAPPLPMFTGDDRKKIRVGPFWDKRIVLVSNVIDFNEMLESLIRKYIRTTPEEEYQKEDPTE